mmetsp:Transcript_15842/g.20937  ORF Transcript_15842/g.20937 Transcript_15842/m.20937 type:complete len:506 (+) Transcript_15842:53-1570(+)
MKEVQHKHVVLLLMVLNNVLSSVIAFHSNFLAEGLVALPQSFQKEQRSVVRKFIISPKMSDEAWMEELKAATTSGGSKKMFGLKKSEGDEKIKQNDVLLDWLSDNGVYIFDKSDWGQAPHALAVSTETADEFDNEPSGRGMVARYEIKEGDELFTLPFELTLTKVAAEKEFGKNIIHDGLSEYFAIAMLLIKERSKGESSFWKPYIDVLPTLEEVNPTIVWSEEDLATLEGSPLVSATISLKLKLKKEFETLNEDIFQKYPDIFPADVFNLEAYKWAFVMLFSRAICINNLEDGPAIALVPYADLFNHNPFASSFIDARSKGGFFTQKKQEVVVYADRGYKKFEQVFISYGQKSNLELLLLYGFALDRNPYNSVDLTVVLPDSDPLYTNKKEFLEDKGIKPVMEFPVYNDRYPDELLQFLRLVCLTPEQLGSRPLDYFTYGDRISGENELDVLNLIAAACKESLGQYPNSEEEDTALMSDYQLFKMFSKSQRMAIKARRQEKRIL